MYKITVAFFAANAYSLFNQDYNTGFGGAEVDLYNFAMYLAQDDRFDVMFYTGDFGQSSDIQVYENIKVQKIRMFGWTNKNIKQKIIFYFSLGRMLLKSPAKVILTEMADEMIGWASIYFKVITDRAHIHRLASDKDTTYVDMKSSKRPIMYYLYHLALKKADFLFSQSRDQQILLKNNMGYDSIVVPNGFFIPEKSKRDSKKHILWVGRAVPLKRPLLFMELSRRFPQYKFVMIMPSTGQNTSHSFKSMIAESLDSMKDCPNFVYKDYVAFNEIQKYFDEAKLFVNTSEYEGFPNTFVQACLGAAPIASLSVNPDGFIDRYDLGRFFNDDFDAMAEFIKNMDSNKETMQSYSDNAYRYVADNHNIKNTGQAYKDAILQISK